MAKILICGAGALGIYLGTMLSEKGHDVTLFGRNKLRKLREIVYINRKQYTLPYSILSLPKKKSYDSIFVTVKLYDLEEVFTLLADQEIRSTFLVSIQNGLADLSPLAEGVDSKFFTPITVFESFTLERNNIRKATSPLGWKVANTPEGRTVARLLSSAGIACTADKLFGKYRAEKMIFSCTLGALSAIEQKTAAELFADPEICKRIDVLFDECYTILQEDHLLESFALLRERLYAAGQKMDSYSSLYRDLISERKTEIDYLNGYMVRLGKEVGKAVVENQKILDDFEKITK